MQKPLIRLAALAIAALVLSACGGPQVNPDGTSMLRGEIVHDRDSRAGATNVVELALVDVSDPDTRVGVLARERISRPGAPPMEFRIFYNVHSLQSGHRYAVCARARDAAGEVVWATSRLESVSLPTDERIPVPVTDDRRHWAECRQWRE